MSERERSGRKISYYKESSSFHNDKHFCPSYRYSSSSVNSMDSLTSRYPARYSSRHERAHRDKKESYYRGDERSGTAKQKNYVREISVTGSASPPLKYKSDNFSSRQTSIRSRTPSPFSKQDIRLERESNETELLDKVKLRKLFLSVVEKLPKSGSFQNIQGQEIKSLLMELAQSEQLGFEGQEILNEHSFKNNLDSGHTNISEHCDDSTSKVSHSSNSINVLPGEKEESSIQVNVSHFSGMEVNNKGPNKNISACLSPKERDNIYSVSSEGNDDVIYSLSPVQKDEIQENVSKTKSVPLQKTNQFHLSESRKNSFEEIQLNGNNLINRIQKLYEKYEKNVQNLSGERAKKTETPSEFELASFQSSSLQKMESSPEFNSYKKIPTLDSQKRKTESPGIRDKIKLQASNFLDKLHLTDNVKDTPVSTENIHCANQTEMYQQYLYHTVPPTSYPTQNLTPAINYAEAAQPYPRMPTSAYSQTYPTYPSYQGEVYAGPQSYASFPYASFPQANVQQYEYYPAVSFPSSSAVFNSPNLNTPRIPPSYVQVPYESIRPRKRYRKPPNWYVKTNIYSTLKVVPVDKTDKVDNIKQKS